MPPSPTKAPAASGRKVVGQPYELEGDGLRKADHHYREARTQILRTLGKSAHRNGSQFAILWVTPDGRSEAFASEALQDRLQNWLGKDAQAEARELVRRHRAERDQRRRAGLEVLAGDKVFGTAGEIVAHTETTKGLFLSDGDAMDLGDSEEGALSGRVPILIDPSTLLSPDALPLPPPPAPFGNDDSLPAPSAVGGASPVLGNDFSPPAFSHGLPGTATSSRFNGSAHELGPSPRLSAASAPSPAGSSSSPFLAPSAVAPVPPVTSPVPSRLIRRTFTPDELVDWYSERFGDLWHKVDKLVCKAWIKTVEPQKQTKFQYQRGDKTKPGWWPESVRHKEPDHLAKPERITLLVHLLRNGPASIEELQLATGAVSAHIPHEKMRILREIYDIAKQEKEVVERSNDGTFTTLTVALEAPTSPKEDEPDEPKQHNTRHRARRSIGQNGELSASMPASAPPHATTASSLQQQQQQQAPTQQTPRGANRLQPYPLARSQSVSDVYTAANGSATGADGAFAMPGTARSPGAGAGTPSMSRSQSLAGPITSSGRPRNVSLSKRDTPKDGAELLATPYPAGKVSRATVTPGRPGSAAPGSPLAPSATSMSRSFSASAVGGSGGTAPGSSATKRTAKAAAIDDSVASPAMLKSRSRLSQQHFDQMVLGAADSGAAHRRGTQSAQVVQQPRFEPLYEQQQQQQLPPNFQLHQHHQQQLAQMQQQQQPHHMPPHQPPRPPLHHTHSQPLPLPHQRPPAPPSHAHPHAPQHAQMLPAAPPGQILVYGPFPPGTAPPNLAHAPPLARQSSQQSMGAPSATVHVLPAPPPLHSSFHQLSPVVQPHHQFAAPSPHLPQPTAHLQHQHQRQHQQQHPHQHQHHQQHVAAQMQLHMQHSHGATEYDAFSAPPLPPPAHHMHPHSQSRSPYLGGSSHTSPAASSSQPHHLAQAPVPRAGSAAGSSYPTPTTASYASPFLGAVGTPGSVHQAGGADGFLAPPLAGGSGTSDPDWSAFVQPLEGLGLGVDVDPSGGLAFEDGYYGGEGEDEFAMLSSSAAGAGLGMEEVQARIQQRERDEARRRYEEHAFGVAGMV